MEKPTIRGEMPMWKAPASVLCGCLAALPLIGCAGDVATPQATAVTPAAIAERADYYTPAARVYAVARAVPAAVLVLWPSDDSLARDPGLWTAQGFDVVMPQPGDIYRLVADQQAALARLVGSAHALADAPIWVVGSGPVIDAALVAPRSGGGVSGVVMTSVASGTRSCSESFFYSDPGTGANPAAPYRGIGRGEEFTAGRKGASSRRADKVSAPWVRQTPRTLIGGVGRWRGRRVAVAARSGRRRVAIALAVSARRRRWRRCRSSAGYGAGGAADRRAESGAMSAANRTADGRPRAGPEQPAADRALARVVGVRTASQPQDEGRRDNAGSDQSIHYDFLSQSSAQQRVKRKNSSG